MKKMLAFMLVLCMTMSLAACGSPSSQAPAEETNQPTAEAEPAEEEGKEDAADETNATEAAEVDPVTIRIYNPVSGATTDGMIENFSQLVSDYSNGAITCDITPAGTLGAEKETGDMLQLGDIDLTLLSIDGVDMATANVGMSWICLPFLFDSYEDVDSEFVNGWMFERQQEVAREAGLDLVAPIENGLKVLIANGKEVQTLEDFKGMVLRVPDIKFHHAYYTALGAMPISGIDQYTGMQQGTMDGIPNNPWALELFNVDEVCEWIMELNDIYGTMYWVANADFTSNLTDEQREIIYKACEETAVTTRQEMRKIGEDWLQMCKDDPDINVYEPSEEMVAKMKEIAHQIWEEYADQFDPVAMERILSEYTQ